MVMPSEKRGRAIRPLLKDEDEYRRAVNRRVVQPFIKSLRARVARARTYDEAIAIIEDVNLTQAAERAANQMPSRRLSNAATNHHKRFVRSVQSLIGPSFNPAAGNIQAADFLESSIQANSNYVKGITDDIRAKMRDELNALRDQPLTKQGVNGAIRKARRTGLMKSKLITRDQYSKFYGGLSEIRQTASGIDAYIWRTQGDDRVRPEHAAQDGNRYAWSDPPSTGIPGSAVNCRCLADPVIPKS